MVFAAKPSAARTDRAAFRVEYSAPEGCPGAGDFVGRVLDRSEHGRLAPGQELARTMRVALEIRKTGAEGTLEFLDRDGAPVVRYVAGATCEEAAEALALITALAVDAQVADSPKEDEAILPWWVLEPPGVVVPGQPAGLTADSERTPDAADYRGGFEGWAHSAALPGVGYGFGVFGQVSPHHGTTRFELGAHWATVGTITRHDEEARFDLTAGRLAACVWAEQWDEVSLGPCGMLELGAIRGEGRSSDRIAASFTKYRLWLAADVVGRLEWALGPSLGLHLQAGLSLPLLHPGFLYQEPKVEVFRPPKAGLVAVAGMSWGAP